MTSTSHPAGNPAAPSAASSPPSPAQAAASPADGFAQAAARLSAQRPLRDERLRRIATLLAPPQPPGLAEVAIDSFLRERPDDADALNLKARALMRQGRTEDAIAALQRCVSLAPDFALARYNLAHLLFRQHRPDEALPHVEQLRREAPRQPQFRELHAAMLEAGAQDLPRAAALYRELAEEHPQRAEGWLSLAHALRALGQRDACAEACRRAIACRPGFGAAWWALANLRTRQPLDAQDVATLRQLLADGQAPAAERPALHYALAKALEDEGRYEEAFAHYAQGNAAMRQRIRYDPLALSRSVSRQAALFTPDFLASRQTAGCPAPDPIFIIGRPRSGSTLVEQMLASHPAIEGTAELPYIGAIAAQLAGRPDEAFGTAHLQALERLTPEALAELGRSYLHRAARHRHLGRPFFLDKTPGNFFHVGLIALILPNARIIDVQRDPAACCLSIFKSYSSKGMLGLAELGRAHGDYLALMRHFDHVLPGRVHHVRYESLVRDPEGELRRLLGYLGLPFDEACLRFHETERPVLTPSSEQVRQPLFTSAVDSWRQFEPWLAPLLESLSPAAGSGADPAHPEAPRGAQA